MKETQPYNENSFPWYMVDSKWNAVARDSDYTSWTLYEEKPGYNGTDGLWYSNTFNGFTSLTETVQRVIGVDMSKWNDIPWEDSLMLRPGYEQQDTVEPALDDTISDEEASVVYSSSTKEYPVVKLKNLHKFSTGDVVRLKKTGELVELVEYSETECSGCKFFTYDSAQHPCYKCAYTKNAYVDYNPTAETQDETFTNTELKEYADLDSKTKQLLEVKYKEGKVEFINCCGNWVKKNKVLNKFYNGTVYRVV